MRMYQVAYTGLNDVPGTARHVLKCLQRHGLDVRRGFIGDAVPNYEPPEGIPFRGLFKAVRSQSLMKYTSNRWVVEDEQAWMSNVNKAIVDELTEFYQKKGLATNRVFAHVGKLTYSQEYHYSCQLKCVNQVGLIHQVLNGLYNVTNTAVNAPDPPYDLSISGMLHLPIYKINDNGINCIVDFRCRVSLDDRTNEHFLKEWEGFQGFQNNESQVEPTDPVTLLSFRKWVANELQNRIVSIFSMSDGVMAYAVKQTSPFGETPEVSGRNDVVSQQQLDKGACFILRYDVPQGMMGVTMTVANVLRRKNYNLYRGFMAEVPHRDKEARYPRTAAFKVYTPLEEKEKWDFSIHARELEGQLNEAIEAHCARRYGEQIEQSAPRVLIGLAALQPQDPTFHDSITLACQLTTLDRDGLLLEVLEKMSQISLGQEAREWHDLFNIDHLIVLANRMERRKGEKIIEMKLSVRLDNVTNFDESPQIRAQYVRDELVKSLKSVQGIFSVTCKPTTPVPCPAAGFLSKNWQGD